MVQMSATPPSQEGSVMKRSLFFIVFFFGVALCLGAMTSAAQAQATRTWVSGLGDDANPCSRTAPCKTFAGAYSRTAAGGEIDALDPGGFGTLTISKALTIDGGGGQVASVLSSATTYGFRIIAGATDIVTLRNLRFNGTVQYASPGTYGISWGSGGVLNIDNCVVQGFTSFGIDFEPTNAGVLNMRDTTVQDATGGGLISSATSGINRVNIMRSYFLNNGAFGVKSGNNSRVHVSDSLIARTNADGVIANIGAVTLESTTVTGGNSNGIHAQNTGIIWISNTMITNNTGIGMVADAGTQIYSFGQNRSANNTGGQGAPTGPAVPGQQ